MKIREEIPQAEAEKSKYDFNSIKPGNSAWVETHSERVCVMKAFEKFKAETGARINAKSRQVGANDPDGPGYRIDFSSSVTALKPSVMARLPKFADFVGPKQQMNTVMNWTGLFTDEDIIEAVMSMDNPPAMIGEAKAAYHAVIAGQTPKQLAYCRLVHGMTLAEYREKSNREWEERFAASQQRQADSARRAEELRIRMEQEENK